MRGIMERERLGSRLGFILLSAGCAIGIGNVWKFPYMAGQYGGGAFVLCYLFFLIILGIPVMTIEFSLGRASRKSPVRLYQTLEKPGQKWHLHGYVAMAGNYLLMMFYTTVAGWMLHYFFYMADGTFVGTDAASIGNIFGSMLADPYGMIGFMAVVVLLGFEICSIGLQNGLEKVSKIMMLVLLAIMVVLAVNSLLLKGAEEGLRFYLLPDLERMTELGIGNVLLGAMTQAFFTLSLGIGAMAIWGSYIGKERTLLGEAVNVAALDTFVAFVSGLIIFPACFAYGISPDSGPSLIFVTLPNIFNHMPAGRLWGSLFFVFMFFAAFSTVLAVFENIISCCMDLFGWARKKACYINALAVIVLSLPCAAGYNLLSGFQPRGAGSTVLDLEDFLVSNLFLPLGSLIYVVFATSRYGWGWNRLVAEANQGKGLKLAGWMRLYMTYVLPVIVLIVFWMSL